MADFRYVVLVRTDSQTHANQVMVERLGYDEEVECTDQECGCGQKFDYKIGHEEEFKDG